MACETFDLAQITKAGGCVAKFPTGSSGQYLGICADGCPCWTDVASDLTVVGSTLIYTKPDGTLSTINICTDLVSKCSINSLSDVDTVSTPPVAGDRLQFDGTNWAVTGNNSFVCGDLNDCVLDALGDVQAPSPAAGEVLQYNGSFWVNAANPVFSCASLNGCSVDALSDVDTTTTAPVTNDLFTWSGTNWIPISRCSASPFTLTNTGDLSSGNVRRIEYNTATCTLNVPVPVQARIQTTTSTVLVAGDALTVITAGMTVITDTYGVMAAGPTITLPYTGRYTLESIVQSNSPRAAAGDYIGATIFINGVHVGFGTAPLAVAISSSARYIVINQTLSAGDTINVGAFTNRAGGANINFAMISVILQE